MKSDLLVTLLFSLSLCARSLSLKIEFRFFVGRGGRALDCRQGYGTWGATAQRCATRLQQQSLVRSSFRPLLLPVRTSAHQLLHPASALRRTSRRALLCDTLELSCTSADNELIHRSKWAGAA